MYIANQAELAAFAERARSSSVLAIDTEFLREKTYYPKLCLLQMATDDEVAIVDPFEVDDLSVLAPLMTNQDIVKLFHAGTQDLEILLREVGALPKPLFDTQVAAALLGHAQQAGYGSLVHSVCGIMLKKADSFTDWSSRPLKDSQLKYAADDVIYLPEMYRKMKASLEEKGRLSWLDNDFAELSDPARYVVNPRERFRRLKRVNQLTRKQMAAAREFAAWREEEAQRCDIPRRWLVTDEQIVEACKREAKSIDQLYMVRGLREALTTRRARVVVDLMRAALKSPEDTWPELDRPTHTEPNVDVQVDLMNALVRLRSKENGIAFQTLASHDDLARLARGHENIDIMKGWRRALIGNELKDLLSGKIRLSIVNGRPFVERMD